MLLREVYAVKSFNLLEMDYFLCRNMESTRYCSLPLNSIGYNTRQESELQNTGQIQNVDFIGDISLPTCNGFYGSTEIGGGSVDIRNMKNTVEGPRNVSLPSCSSLIYSGKETEVDNTGQSASIVTQDSAMDDLSAISCLGLQLGTQQPYYPYNPPIPETKKLVVGKEVINFEGSPVSYEVQGNYDYDFNSSLFGSIQLYWNPTTDACVSTSIDGNSYQVYHNTPQPF